MERSGAGGGGQGGDGCAGLTCGERNVPGIFKFYKYADFY